jgi:uncharacterized OB-fold protein
MCGASGFHDETLAASSPRSLVSINGPTGNPDSPDFTMTDLRPEAMYFEHLAQGRLMLQRSRASGSFFFYPRVAAPMSGARDLEWVEASGLGTVYSTTVVRVRPPHEPYNVSLVDLLEGPRVMSRVEGVAPDAVRIGMKVKARIGQQDDKPILLFDVMPDEVSQA